MVFTNLKYPTKGIVDFYNGRGTAEQWIKEGEYALIIVGRHNTTYEEVQHGYGY